MYYNKHNINILLIVFAIVCYFLLNNIYIMSPYANNYLISKMRLLNFCYLRGFKHGLLIANNIDKPSLHQYFSVTADVCPCTLSVYAYEEFKKSIVSFIY